MKKVTELEFSVTKPNYEYAGRGVRGSWNVAVGRWSHGENNLKVQCTRSTSGLWRCIETKYRCVMECLPEWVSLCDDYRSLGVCAAELTPRHLSLAVIFQDYCGGGSCGVWQVVISPYYYHHASLA